ncbi:MAG TPA: TIGR00730 family Rossman fold protein [Chloroflexota bacterium]|nr:TIGR00730 family Rossman fold protein [Chloroflexota bacterium]
MTKGKATHSICVFCASSDLLAPAYFALARQLGEEMVKTGYSLVYGGGQVGLMGTVARAVQATGGKVVGVIPRRDDWAEVVFEDADDLIYTVTMRERKAIMAERADAFIALPGGASAPWRSCWRSSPSATWGTTTSRSCCWTIRTTTVLSWTC